MLFPPVMTATNTAFEDPPAYVATAEVRARPELPAGIRIAPPAQPSAVTARAPSAAIVAPAALPSAAELRDAIEDIGLSGTVVEARTLDRRYYGSVRVDANTRVGLSLSGSTLTLTASPGLALDLRFGPEVRIGTLRLDLQGGTLDVDAEGPGPDSIYRGIANWVANRYLRELIPDALRAGGYEPRADAGATAAVVHLISGLLTGEPGPGGVRVRDLSGFAMLQLGRDVAVDLPDGMRLEIPRTARFTVTPTFEGPPDAPVLRDFTVRDLDSRGITIRKREGTFASIEGIVVHSATLRPGGQLVVDYEPIPEQVLNGGESALRLMIAAMGAASGDASALRVLDHVPDHRLTGMRSEIDAQIRDQAAPQLVQLVRDHDRAIDGVSLVSLFALDR